jgi:hemolysin III
MERRELVVDRCANLAGLGLALFAVAALLGGTPGASVGVWVYGIALVAMFALSMAYNFPPHERRSERLRRYDHATIFLLIAGSYTPFALGALGATGHVLLAVVWTGAAVGVVITLAWPRRFERTKIALYLGLGWLILAALGPAAAALPARTLILLLVGGVFYSLGVPIHLWRRLPYQAAIWHLFVLIGAACHYAAVLDGVVLAANSGGALAAP